MKQERRHPGASALEGSVFLVLWFSFAASAAPQQSGAGENKKTEETTSKRELSDVETTEERREGLDRELDSSLSEFDALILREQEILEKRREAEGAAGGGGGAGTAEVGGGAEDGDEGEGEGRGERAEGTGNSPDEPSGDEVAREDGAPEDSEAETGEDSNERVPADVGDGRDDDIVARQLREAAMKEEDPELREKLWDEYRAYKFGEKKETQE
jgi:hypothetical protein